MVTINIGESAEISFEEAAYTYKLQHYIQLSAEKIRYDWGFIFKSDLNYITQTGLILSNTNTKRKVRGKGTTQWENSIRPWKYEIVTCINCLLIQYQLVQLQFVMSFLISLHWFIRVIHNFFFTNKAQFWFKNNSDMNITDFDKWNKNLTKLQNFCSAFSG